MSKNFSRPSRQRAAAPLLLFVAAFLSAGCEGKDESILLPPAAGSGGSGTAGAGGTGAGGTGGAGEPSDAGPDATTDASSGRSCVVGSLEAYCAIANGVCPTSYAEARAKLSHFVNGGAPAFILQQQCTAPDGSQLIEVSGDYRSLSVSYIFHPGTEQLVSVFVYDDLGGCPAPGERIDDESFGSIHGFYGEELPGCTFRYDDYVVPSACRLPPNWRSLDAGALRSALIDAGADAGSLDDGGPYECILAP